MVGLAVVGVAVSEGLWSFVLTPYAIPMPISAITKTDETRIGFGMVPTLFLSNAAGLQVGFIGTYYASRIFSETATSSFVSALNSRSQAPPSCLQVIVFMVSVIA